MIPAILLFLFLVLPLIYILINLYKKYLDLRIDSTSDKILIKNLTYQLNEASKTNTYESSYYRQKYEEAVSVILSLRSQLSAYRNSNSYNYNYDSDVKDAIKYAMKKSHPDNGGTKEDFIKFNALYEKICK